MAARAAGRAGNDRRVILIVAGAMVLAITALAILAPSPRSDDPRPTTTNAGPAGAKAAYLLLQALGRSTTRWTKPLDELDSVDAANSTLVLAEPFYLDDNRKQLSAAVQRFLERGGHVLATGQEGARLLPGGEAKMPSGTWTGPCHTTPEGPGPLAAVGEVEMADDGGWSAEGPRFRVEQRCGADAAVVRFAVGKGEAVWWTSSTPLSNAGLKDDASLKLLLASLGDGRAVIFDESLHGLPDSFWSKAKGLPLTWMEAQAALVALLLVLSFSRRRGPLRPLNALPRTSPVEFAASMGALYEKAGATAAATEAARRRLVRVLVREAGVAQDAVEAGPEAIAQALTHRLGGNWNLLAVHLESAAGTAGQEISPGSALALVQAMAEDAEAVRAKLRPVVTVATDTV